MVRPVEARDPGPTSRGNDNPGALYLGPRRSRPIVVRILDRQPSHLTEQLATEDVRLVQERCEHCH